MKRPMAIFAIFLSALAMAGCAATGHDSVAIAAGQPFGDHGELREVKLVWEHSPTPRWGRFKSDIDDVQIPDKYVIYYGEKSRYGWWDEKCSEADNIFQMMEVARRDGLKMSFSAEEWKLVRDCPVAYPYQMYAGTATQVTLKLPRYKKFYAAARAWQNNIGSRYTEEIEIPAE